MAVSAGARRGALPFLAIGAVIESALVAGLVQPLWLFDHRDAIPTPEPLATATSISGGSMLRFAVTLLVWLGGYAGVLLLVRGELTIGARRALVLLPVVFAATLLFVLPVSSKDVYHYTMEGRIAVVYGDNPASVPPNAYPQDRLYWIMSSWQETPSRYGPVHNLLSAGIVAAGRGSLTVTLIGFKLLALAALFGAAFLIHRTATSIRPELGTAAFVLVAWNPQALYEAGANAHNDLLMVFFTALALYLAAKRRWDLAFPALAIGVLTKYVVVLLGPALLICAGLCIADDGSVRRWWSLRLRVPRAALLGLAWTVALTAVLYAPFWDGLRTFTAVTSASGDMLGSPGWALRHLLKHVLGWYGARPVVVVLMTSAFLVGYARILRELWRRQRQQPQGAGAAATQVNLALACLLILALELCTVSWWFWPWYTLWLLPPAALLIDRRLAALTAVVTALALLAYIPINFREYFWGLPTTDRMPLTEVLLIFVAPALVAGAFVLRERRPRWW
jgi:alpha-1,6-mannosyltransferase